MFLLIVVLVIAFIIFRIIHRIFDITYLGGQALLTMILGCLAAAYMLVDFLFL
ncbi:MULTISPECIES: hypothetical protein [Brevibacillus]|uniref:Uncharacterized protein n=1 Tax=Brevibacillus composti TaxID=2796470 RepID=A0A7T5EKD7_9BACL|nr:MULTISPECIES: hypothetical protein [Brevibacillus]MCC0567362.1 hypothetical protein [Brevibacillus borstelensis]MCM3472348.1 hypothetical protein [Brevibacillus borstelensis]MCM3561746.1 hypothetical protein [Brevibacillus borstelensis]MCM3590130.1 hypothetical protein [Brevibacillus borstelensis]MCM3625130.1 hypothetical protein [Brevibacillus borstelensis]